VTKILLLSNFGIETKESQVGKIMTVLMAIGGNMRLDGEIVREFFRRSGGSDARLVIIPSASSRLNGGAEFIQTWQDMGLNTPPLILPVHERVHSFESQHIAAIQQASGIFFTGGNQLRLTTVLAGTPLQKAIADVFRQGTVVAGTSAGAAVMGRIMISGGKTSTGARFGTAQFAEGFGFYENLLFDQHFYQRNRIGRLIYAVTLHPHLIGVGLDEDTAALLVDGCMTVIGKRVVTIIDGQDIMETNIDQVSSGAWFGVSQLRLHQLTEGCQFDIATRVASIHRQPLQPDENRSVA
jgi:cyanophycinase